MSNIGGWPSVRGTSQVTPNYYPGVGSSIAAGFKPTRALDSHPQAIVYHRGMRIESQSMILGGIDTSDGSVAPCLVMNGRGARKINWPVSGGVATTLSIQVKQVINISPRPRMVLKANPLLGLSETESVASSSTGWVTLSITFTPTKNGVVVISLENRLDSPRASTPCKWDNLIET